MKMEICGQERTIRAITMKDLQEAAREARKEKYTVEGGAVIQTWANLLQRIVSPPPTDEEINAMSIEEFDRFIMTAGRISTRRNRKLKKALQKIERGD